MQIPERVPGLRLLTLLAAAYAVAWTSLEGSLPRVVVMGVATTVVIAGHLTQRLLAGQWMGAARWLALAAGGGLTIGLSCALFSLAFMAVKTGLHAHGPEFRSDEIEWVVRQIPIWGAAGLLSGSGLGLLALSSRGR